MSVFIILIIFYQFWYLQNICCRLLEDLKFSVTKIDMWHSIFGGKRKYMKMIQKSLMINFKVSIILGRLLVYCIISLVKDSRHADCVFGAKTSLNH